MTPSASARIASILSMARGFSILAIRNGCIWAFANISRTGSISFSWRTKDKATKSTPCCSPKAGSFRSFSVKEGTRSVLEGRLTPLWEWISSPTSTSQTMASAFFKCEHARLRQPVLRETSASMECALQMCSDRRAGVEPRPEPIFEDTLARRLLANEAERSGCSLGIRRNVCWECAQ